MRLASSALQSRKTTRDIGLALHPFGLGARRVAARTGAAQPASAQRLRSVRQSTGALLFPRRTAVAVDVASCSSRPIRTRALPRPAITEFGSRHDYDVRLAPSRRLSRSTRLGGFNSPHPRARVGDPSDELSRHADAWLALNRRATLRAARSSSGRRRTPPRRCGLAPP